MPDSAGTATAYWCGYKGNYETLGVDARVSAGQCGASKVKRNSRPCLMDWAQQAGKDTGQSQRDARGAEAGQPQKDAGGAVSTAQPDMSVGMDITR